MTIGLVVAHPQGRVTPVTALQVSMKMPVEYSFGNLNIDARIAKQVSMALVNQRRVRHARVVSTKAKLSKKVVPAV